MNVVDALVMSLGFDSSEFERNKRAADASFQDLKGKSKKQGDEIERHARFVGEAINKLAVKLIGIAALAGGGIQLKNFVENITKTDASIGRLSNSLGISANKLGAWDLLGRRVGGAAGEVAGALQSLNDQFQELKIHGTAPTTGPLAQAWRFGGGSFNPFAPWQDNVRLLAKQLQNIAKTDPALAHKVGIDATQSEALTQALIAGGPDLEALLTDAQQLVGLTKQDVEAAKARQIAYTNLEAAVNRLLESISTRLTPALLYVNDLMLWLVSTIQDNLPSIDASIGGYFNRITTDLETFKALFTGDSIDIRTAWGRMFKEMLADDKWWADQAIAYGSKILPAMQSAFNASVNWVMGRFSEIYAAFFGHPFFSGSQQPGGTTPAAKGSSTTPRGPASLSTGAAGGRGGAARGGGPGGARTPATAGSGYSSTHGASPFNRPPGGAATPSAAPSNIGLDIPLSGGAASRADSLTGMQPEFRARLARMMKDAPPGASVFSGYRSPELQARLFAHSDRSGHMVAAPGHSHHGRGDAADVKGDLKWFHEHAHEYGLTFPMSYENWHIQLDPNTTVPAPQSRNETMPQHLAALAAYSRPGAAQHGRMVNHVHIVNQVARVDVHSRATNIADAIHDIRPAMKKTFAGGYKDFA